MKKIFCFALALALAVCASACANSKPKYYDFYSDFQPPSPSSLPVRVEDKRKDMTDNENMFVLQNALGLTALQSHRVFVDKDIAVVDFYFDSSAGAHQIYSALDYAYDTFWLGGFHTEGILPYEDWQYRDSIKDFTVQIFIQDQLIFARTYTFTQLTDRGEKQREITETENKDLYFEGQIIEIPVQEGEDYFGIFDLRGRDCSMVLRQSLDGQTATLCLNTFGQIDNENLRRLKDAVYRKTGEIAPELTIELYDGTDGEMYYRY